MNPARRLVWLLVKLPVRTVVAGAVLVTAGAILGGMMFADWLLDDRPGS